MCGFAGVERRFDRTPHVKFKTSLGESNNTKLGTTPNCKSAHYEGEDGRVGLLRVLQQGRCEKGG